VRFLLKYLIDGVIVPRSKAEEVDKAVKSAEAAFESWSILPPSKRAQERINASVFE